MPTLPQKTAGDKPAEIDWAAALQGRDADRGATGH